MSGPCAAPRTWRSTASVNGRSLASPSRMPGGSVTSCGTPCARKQGCGVEPEADVGAQRARVAGWWRSGGPWRRRRTRGSAPGSRGRGRRTAGRAHRDLGQDPQVLAPERERAGGEALLVLGHPGAVRVGAQRVARSAGGPSPGPGALRPAAPMRRSRSSPAANASSVSGLDVGFAHRADLGHARQDYDRGGDGQLLDRRPAPGLHRIRVGAAPDDPAPRPAVQPADARDAGARARRARAAGGDARPARARRLRPPAREVALLDAGVRRAGDRAARPSRRGRGGRHGHVAGRERGAGGRGAARRSACAGW